MGKCNDFKWDHKRFNYEDCKKKFSISRNGCISSQIFATFFLIPYDWNSESSFYTLYVVKWLGSGIFMDPAKCRGCFEIRLCVLQIIESQQMLRSILQTFLNIVKKLQIFKDQTKLGFFLELNLNKMQLHWFWLKNYTFM